MSIGFAPNLPESGSVSHGFFTRQGGVSKGIYESLNTGEGSKDDPRHIAENRKRVAGCFGQRRTHMLSMHQIHSNRAIFVDGPWPGKRPQADGMVTKTPGLILSALSADCAPVLFYDSHAHIIGAAHAGWRGARAGITDSTIALMCDHGAKPKSICAAIGPCLSQKNFEVGPEFHAAFLSDDKANEKFFKPGKNDRFMFDNKAYLAARLRRAGIENIYIHPDCTYQRADLYFSYRRNTHNSISDYGRNISAIMLKKIHNV